MPQTPPLVHFLHLCTTFPCVEHLEGRGAPKENAAVLGLRADRQNNARPCAAVPSTHLAAIGLEGDPPPSPYAVVHEGHESEGLLPVARLFTKRSIAWTLYLELPTDF